MDFSPADIVPALTVIQTTRTAVLAVYTLSICEWLNTLSTEVELIYPSRWNSIKVAYLLCRYYQLLLWPLVIFAYGGNHTAQTCSKLTRLVSVLLLPMQLFAPAVMLMRAYAFAGRNAKVLALLLLFYAGLVAIDIWFFCWNVVNLPDIVYLALGGTGCFPDYIANTYIGTRLVVAIGASSVMDLVSLSTIAIHSLRTHSTQGNLGRIFISQGFGAFVVVLVVHCVALAIYFDPQNYHNGVGLPYVLIISNLIACRLILGLRRKALPTETEILRRHSQLVDEGLADIDMWVIEEDHPSYSMDYLHRR
ncbi:hypothetical protein DFH07DRAFT_469484 [Mycena maculata]|uniref:DUF6533 domain-containing protein n=1 Tax=Mycena maculata TaxID=230809 RepID=A0AAD7K871_9AGAR|nr:hypothetical protein DFH07DRAFT_469484 [Mycena maculata]